MPSEVDALKYRIRNSVYSFKNEPYTVSRHGKMQPLTKAMCCHYMSVYYKPLLFIFMSFSIFFPLRLIRIFFPLFLLPEQYQFHCLSFYYSNVFQIVLLICMNATNDKQRSNITKHFGKFLSKQITQKYFCNIILHGVCLYLK